MNWTNIDFVVATAWSMRIMILHREPLRWCSLMQILTTPMCPVASTTTLRASVRLLMDLSKNLNYLCRFFLSRKRIPIPFGEELLGKGDSQRTHIRIGIGTAAHRGNVAHYRARCNSVTSRRFENGSVQRWSWDGKFSTHCPPTPLYPLVLLVYGKDNYTEDENNRAKWP